MKLLRTTIQTITLLGIITGSFWVGMCVERLRTAPEVQAQALPSIMDIQRQVGTKPDGVLGKDTQRKWDEAYGNQCAAKYFKEGK